MLDGDAHAKPPRTWAMVSPGLEPATGGQYVPPRSSADVHLILDAGIWIERRKRIVADIDKAIADALAREAARTQAAQTTRDAEIAKRDAMTATHKAFMDDVLVPAFDQVNEALGKGHPPHRLEYAIQGPKACTMRIFEGGNAGYGEPELTLIFKISEHSSGQVRLFTDSETNGQSTSVPALSKVITSLTTRDVANGIVAAWSEAIS